MAEPFARRFREVRILRALSLNALARRSGVAKSTLSRWESGQNEPDIPTLEAVLCSVGGTEQERIELLSLLHAPRAIGALQELDSSGAALEGLGIEVPQAGQALRALRLSRRLSIDDVAIQIGASTRSVRHWEAGTRRPSTDQIQRLAAVLGPEVVHLGRREASVEIDTLDDLIAHIRVQESLFRLGKIPDPAFSRACEKAAWRFAQLTPEALPLLGHQFALSASGALELGNVQAGVELALRARDLPWDESPEPLRSLAPYAALCGAKVYTADVPTLNWLRRELQANQQRSGHRHDLWAWSAIVAAKLGDEASALAYLRRFREELDKSRTDHTESVYQLWRSEVMIDLGRPEAALGLIHLPDIGLYDFAGFRAALLLRTCQALGLRKEGEESIHLLLESARSRGGLNPFQSSSLAVVGIPEPDVEPIALA